jgi:periplasmic protein TonB
VEDQAPLTLASANHCVALEERPHITAEARVGGQTPLASAAANLSAKPAKEATPSSAAEIAEQGTYGAGANSVDRAGTGENAARSLSDSEIAQPNAQASSQQHAKAPEPQQQAEDNTPVAQARKQAQSSETTQPQPPDGTVEQTATIPIAVAEQKPELSSPKVPLPQRAPRAAMKKASQKLAAKEKSAPKRTANPENSQVTPLWKPIGVARAEKASISFTYGHPKPPDAGSTVKEKSAPKLASKPNRRETEKPQVALRWKPMGLAPADKPSISLTQSQPKKADAGRYSTKIWSALARKKLNAGQRGSTTVTFAIGAGGALRFVRVSQSSGNARLDQLALATVRNAAPFPPPPQLKDGAAAYTIRIDFH